MNELNKRIEGILRQGIERNGVLPLDWAMDRINPILEEAKKIQDEKVKELNKTNALDQAEAQFIGFKHAEKGFNLSELVSSMGLTNREWKNLKKLYSLPLDKEQVKEIDKIFGIQK